MKTHYDLSKMKKKGNANNVGKRKRKIKKIDLRCPYCQANISIFLEIKDDKIRVIKTEHHE
jgi:predicted molibdopterin-dependent oxidoreductase YjgC